VGFHGAKDESLKEYTVSEIKFFYLKSLELYEAVERSGSSEKTFLRVLARGKMSLYKQTKGFLIMKDGREYKVQKRDTVINGYTHEDKKYTGLIKILMADCERVAKKSRTVRFTDEDLEKIVQAYNDCDKPAKLVAREPYSHTEKSMVGVTGAMSVSKMEFPSSRSEFHKYNFDPRTSFTYGIFLNLPLSRKLSTVVDFVRVSRGADVKGGDTKYNTFPSKEDLDFNLKYNQVGISFRYFPFFGRIKPFVTGGVLMGRASTAIGFRRIYVGGPVEYTIRKDFDFQPGGSRLEYGFKFGGGVNTEIGTHIILGLNYTFEKVTANPGKSDWFSFTSSHLTMSAAVKLEEFFRR
jgi:opacity protein-like surface antigen